MILYRASQVPSEASLHKKSHGHLSDKTSFHEFLMSTSPSPQSKSEQTTTDNGQSQQGPPLSTMSQAQKQHASPSGLRGRTGNRRSCLGLQRLVWRFSRAEEHQHEDPRKARDGIHRAERLRQKHAAAVDQPHERHIDGAHARGTLQMHDVDVLDPRMDVVDLRRRVGMVFQKPNPFPKSIYDNVAFGPRLHMKISRRRNG